MAVPQLSVATAGWNTTIAPQSPSSVSAVTSPGQPIVGAVVSLIMKSAEVVIALPHSSVAVKVTVVIASQTSLFNVVKSLVQVIDEHVSEASAPPLAANQILSSDVLPLPYYSNE